MNLFHNLLPALFLLPLSGCGGEPMYHVSGRVVTADGTPIHGGQVEFRGLDRPISAVGYIGTDGRFELSFSEPGDGAPVGKYRVALIPPAPPAGIPGVDDSANAVIRERWLEQVPRRYRSVETSGLEFNVSDDPSLNTFEIEIETM